VTPIAVHGAEGAGLRTARLQIARLARLAGFVVIDSRFGVLPEVVSSLRHLCVFDWLPSTSALPSILSLAAATGAHRHVWIRFCRRPLVMTGAGSLELEPLIMRDLTRVVFVDEELGPTAAELRRAAAAARGLPGSFTAVLSTTRSARGVTGVHETAPAYAGEAPDTVAATGDRLANAHERVAGIRDAGTPRPGGAAGPAGQAGTGRLERAVDAAIAIAGRGRHARAARVLVRCAEGLAARGAVSSAARAWCALGELHLARARPERAAEAFDRARRADPGGATSVRALIGAGVAHLERGDLSSAEAALRTAIVGNDVAQARVQLAQTLFLKRRFDAAEEALGGRAPALLSRIRHAAGDLPGAAIAAAEAVRASDVNHEPASSADAHAAAAHVEAALGRYEEARRHADLATRAAKEVRQPEYRWRIAADAASVLARCGVPLNGSRRGRLLRATARLPPLAAARIRAALRRSDEDDRELRRFVDASGATLLLPARDERLDLIGRFQALVDAVHATADEAGALQAIATDLLRASDACSVVIRSARLGRSVAGAGRSWAAEEAFTRALLDGGDGVFRDGVAPEAAEPVRAAGSVLGSVAVRWVSGSNPPASRVRELLRVSAAAAVPPLRTIAQPDPDRAESESLFPDYLLGRGPAAERVREAIRRAAAAPYPVLVQGESGSGKELVARAIHARSPRRLRRFCAVNCAALTDDLVEAEFFGHARGAFTGAVAERPGLFEEADQGTLFLDEVAELSARAQAKLLRVLQEGEVRRVGENMPRRVDARIVAATNRSVEDEVRAARFRADLRFRLDVIRVTIPPLRERAEDVPWLAQRLWSDAAARLGTKATLSDELIGALARYDWPGNVRELQNAIASIAVHAPRRGRVQASMLPGHLAAAGASSVRGLEEARKEFERRLVRAALAHAAGRKGLAAAQLGITRQGLAKLLKRLAIVPPEPAADRGPEPESRADRQQ
jgi:DNA-binding NtrC family response regulator/tetratricopeptide (TPR) repeat protein